MVRMKEQWMERWLNGEITFLTVASPGGSGTKERQGHCGNSTATWLVSAQSVDKPDQHREAHWRGWYLLPSRHKHGLVKHYLTTYGDSLNTGLTLSSFDLANHTVLSLTRRTPDEKWTSLLCLARFIDRPHQEKPGSPKHCLHSCQAATHTQTLAYITVRYWRSADTNTLKQKPEAYVTPSVLTQATPLRTIPTWERHLEKESQWSLCRSHSCGMACVCLCAFCMWRVWKEMPYKGSQQKHQARQL